MDKERLLIDIDLVVLLLPTILTGTIFGVLLNSVSPTWLVLPTICLVLGYVSYETIKKAIAIRKMESARKKEEDSKASDPQVQYAMNSVSTVNTVPPADSPSALTLGPSAGESSTDDIVTPLRTTDSNVNEHSSATENPRASLLIAPMPRHQSVLSRERAHNAFFSILLDSMTASRARELLLPREQTNAPPRFVFPWQEFACTFLLLAFVILMSLIRGGQSGIGTALLFIICSLRINCSMC